jgi:hypothetical protein
MTFAGKREIGQPLPPHTLQRLERAVAKGHVHGTPAGHNAGVAVQAELAGERARAVLHPPALVQALAHSRAARTQHAAYDAGIKVVENRVEYALWQIQQVGAGKGGRLRLHDTNRPWIQCLLRSVHGRELRPILFCASDAWRTTRWSHGAGAAACPPRSKQQHQQQQAAAASRGSSGRMTGAAAASWPHKR